MPFHSSSDSDGNMIDFGAVYRQLVVPAVEEAGMSPIRADEELQGGIFQKVMFERLVICEFAIADLSTGNPNVYYELGVRHALRPYSTVLIFREGWRLPLDVAHDAALEYAVDTRGRPTKVTEARRKLALRLKQAREAATDSPVHQLVSGLPVIDVDHARIDTFRDHADRDERLRRTLDEAATSGVGAIAAVEAELGDLRDLGVSSALSLLVSYRSVSAWAEVTRVVDRLSRPVQQLRMIREQYAAALNRIGKDAQAERILKELIKERPSSETYGLLGRVYKDRWAGEASTARRAGFLRRAVEAYLKGFETDWRDPYPGINAVTLMSLMDPPDERLPRLLTVVAYAADRRSAEAARDPDYWDHATHLGLAVLTDERDRARRALEKALAEIRDDFEPETTARDLSWIADAMRRRDEDGSWVDELIAELAAARRAR